MSYISDTYIKLLVGLSGSYSTSLSWVANICSDLKDRDICSDFKDRDLGLDFKNRDIDRDKVIYCNSSKFKFSDRRESYDDIIIKIDDLIDRDFLLLYLKLIQNDLIKTKDISENILYIKVPFLPIYLQKKIVSDIESNIISDECIEKLIKYNN